MSPTIYTKINCFDRLGSRGSVRPVAMACQTDTALSLISRAEEVLPREELGFNPLQLDGRQGTAISG
jgi:hypothetical protein